MHQVKNTLHLVNQRWVLTDATSSLRPLHPGRTVFSGSVRSYPLYPNLCFNPCPYPVWPGLRFQFLYLLIPSSLIAASWIRAGSASCYLFLRIHIASFWVFLVCLRIIKWLLLLASIGIGRSSCFSSSLVSSPPWAGNLLNTQQCDLFDLMILLNALYIEW